MVGTGDDVEGVVRHGPPGTPARPLRQAQDRLITNGLGAWLVDDGLEFVEVAVFGVAGALDEEGGDGDVGEVGEGVSKEGAPAVGVDVSR